MTARSNRSRDDDGADAALVAAVSESARDNVGDWFPELGGRRPHTSLLHRSNRPRCTLYVMAISDGRRSREVVVKVRRHDAPERRVDRYDGARPVLTPERVLPAAETGRREYEGLRLIEDLFGDAHPARHGVLRALAWLPANAALVMDRAGDPTLRDVLARQSRLRPTCRNGPPDEQPWRNSGTWLRRYHRGALPGLTERLADRDATVDLVDSFVGFLAEAGHDSGALRSVADAAAVRLATDLPRHPHLVIGHGDYVPQNMFAGAGGMVTGFDPMPLWLVPHYEDVARLASSIRLLPEQNLSQGIAFDDARLDAYERAFLEGYFDPDPIPYGAVRGFQVLVLLDRWGALVSKQRASSGRTRHVVHDLRVRTTSRSFRREANRLTVLLRD